MPKLTATPTPPPTPSQSHFPNARVRGVPAIGRAFAVLRLLAQSDEPLGVHACARAVGMIPSTCLHILRALVEEGILTVDPATKRYRMGLGLVMISHAALRRSEPLRAIQSQLDDISARHGVTAMLARIVDSDHSIVVALSHSDQAMRFNVSIGSRYPTLIGASGRCYAAFSGMPEKDSMKRVTKLQWSRRPSLTDWKKQIAMTRVKGYALDVGNYIEGATVLSVPVFDLSRALVSTLATVCMSDRITARGIELLAKDLKALAANAHAYAL